MEPTPKQSPAIPIAIICGFAMIALAIFFTDSGPATPHPLTDTSQSRPSATGEIRPVDETDYIFGNPNAPILMIEYSDYDCPFCKQFHNTMQQIMSEYGVDGQVAWVYRQYPIADLHPNSPKISEAALCVGDIGGNDAFWGFTDRIFAERTIEAPTNVTKLPEYAADVGVSSEAYIACMQSRKMRDLVTASFTDAYNAGLEGTPATVITIGTQQAVVDGAQSYETVKGIVTNLVDQLHGNVDIHNPPAPALEEAG